LTLLLREGQRGHGADNPALIRMIRRRHVYHVAGYDPIGAAWYRLFKRELATFARTWNVNATVSDLPAQSDTSHAEWNVTTSAANWQVETTYELLLWDDLVQTDFAQPMIERLAKSLLAFFDIVRTGSAFRYFRANWQYGLFFLFPFLLLCVFALAASLISHAIANWLTASGIAYLALFAPLTAVIFIGLLHWPGKRLGLHQALDDWIFSCDYVYGRRAELDARLQRFAEMLVARTQDTALDEILVVGHSMGATLALEIITRALALDPMLGRRGPAVCLLTVGSTIPKFTLHPAGGRFRRYGAQLAQDSSIAWAEYHARSDAISFYKFDPVTLTRFYGDPMRGKPLLRRVWIQQMLSKRTYWRYRLRFMRLHYQFLMANELRSTYDYFMLVCGPLSFARSVLTPKGPAELIALDGALIDPASPIPQMPPAGTGAAIRPNGPSHHEKMP
jgi:pimeloyl-ACP methyl ester carboxylesterase